MKMRKSDVNILLMVIGLALAAVSYFLVFTKLNEQTDIINAENAKLDKEVQRLQELADNKQQYLDDTAAMQVSIDEYIAQFPAQYLPEDDILYVVGIEKEYESIVESISMGRTNVVDVEKPAQEEVVVETESEEAAAEDATVVTQEPEAEIKLYQTPVEVSMIVGYDNVKDIIKKINTDHDRKSLDSISLAFDSETGDLTGSLGFSMYSLTGTETEYKTPKINGITYGTKNIFNSADKKSAMEAEKAAEEAAEEE